MVIVEFIKPWGAYNAGEKAGFMQRLADELVQTGHVKIAAQQPAAKARRGKEQGCQNGDAHTGHAELVALAGGFRIGQSAQGKNEQDARRQI